MVGVSTAVAQHLLAYVHERRLAPGDQMLSEMETGRELGASRGSVREGYRALAALGIIEIENGRRPRLRAIDSSVLRQVFDYALSTAQVTPAHALELRRAIELQSAHLAAVRMTPVQREQLQELAAQMRHAGTDHRRRTRCDMAIHRLIATGSGNPLHALMLNALSSPLEASAREHNSDRRSASEVDRVIAAHEAVVRCIVAADAEGARAAMSRHFDLSVHNAAGSLGAMHQDESEQQGGTSAPARRRRASAARPDC